MRMISVRGSRTGNDRGFTLLEVVVAMALLGVALAAVIQLFSADLRNIAASDDHVRAVLMAESRMREILASEELREEAWTEESDDGYTFTVSVSETARERTDDLPVRLYEIDLTVQWISDTRRHEFSLMTLKTGRKEI